MLASLPHTIRSELYVIALALFLALAIVWIWLRRRKAPAFSEAQQNAVPLPLSFSAVGYGKAFVCWFFLFMRTFIVRPGLYTLGAADESSPMLVTGNYYLTVFLLARRLRNHAVRLLIIDTKGINVWCSAGKGQFSASEIADKAAACGLLSGEKRLRLVLPKFSLSGVNLGELRKHRIIPVIGPMYAKDVPAFLGQEKHSNQVEDRVDFGLRARAFTALPTAVQFFYYFLGVYVISLGAISPAVVGIATGLAFAYPMLFPWLPGRLFAVKGFWLALAASALSLLFTAGSLLEQLPLMVFLCATAIFVGLSYTGNSAVSNYTSVRKETARFLPVVVLLYLVLIPLYRFF